ncbi:hypothetical protein [Nubsella zeaxanthinifaciens]|uniref:hypothetical protein n=1 Tax=Nubsella zeaxanthinifaciens TaxID=392412 RepID=UPI000DE4AA68|nr:hypothetical protein [Nubsella zeaxanthinifaciens]
MKFSTSLLLLLLIVNFSWAQKKWFSLYTDSAVEMTAATAMTKKFLADVQKVSPGTNIKVVPILNTTPYLIYYDGEKGTVNLPIWGKVIDPIKQFFFKLGGSETEGKRIFGLFFNGFYLPHELGHALQYTVKGKFSSPYEDEVFANQIAILWWRKQGRHKELEQCYQYAKKMYAQLPNPVPAGQRIEEYFGKNYEAAAKDPFVYGYMQFGQFINVYEDRSLPNFDSFLQQFLKQQSNIR